MFYRPAQGHGLPHSPFNAIVAPRPIGWISTRGAKGDNLAPYSFFNAVAYAPPQVIFACDRKDSLRNIEETGVFASNVVSRDLWQQMNQTSAHLPHGSDEFTHAGIEKAECQEIDCPRVALSPATLECRLQQVVTLEGGEDFLVIGTVLGVHIRDEFLTEGRFDLVKAGVMARLGYMDYLQVTDLLELRRPD
ncbi:flavin reductase family protein [Stagnihabitans tardus]|uniref:Flavin reductase family protein n=1 Tax=Stagnihabitans tardus TaxID=2699202 RepID=A0AAE4YD46_9RHOB|nr:flavin reductase family protein [Stagnihabitans tardus]NBZ89859.1 flavin reductase family protein [Stagnihabitans tardus]